MRFLPPRWYERLPSTNTFLLEQARKDPRLRTGTVIAARKQTAGRGRYGRNWFSSPGRDLAFSFLLRCEAGPSRLRSLPMATATGVAATLSDLGVEARLKWPNDVLAAGRKICGVLVETCAGGNDVAAVVGVGLNVNMRARDCERVERPATSILRETGRETEPEGLLAHLLRRLEPRLRDWKARGFAGVREEWERYAYGVGGVVSVQTGKDLVTGVVTGFGPGGELAIEPTNGDRLLLAHGTVEKWQPATA